MKVYTIIHAHSYKIYVGKDVFAQIGEVIDLESFSQIVILTDAKVGRRYLDEAEKQLRKFNKNVSSYTVDSGEKNKNLETVSNIYRALIKKKVNTDSLIVNLGGGVISDMGGFAASTFLRGISFINLPTTLEAMVDASVGGKTGINFEDYKNFIGTFAQPEGVFAEITTLETLPERILIQGHAEAIKHGLIADADFFEKVSSRKINEFREDQLIEIIAHSIQLKANFIHQDEKEQTVRRLLHFGHIIGHALESLSHKTDDPLYHGEAVAIGMIAEAKISQLMGMLPDDEFEIIERSIERVGLPIRYTKKITVDKVLEMIETDKKSLGGNIKWNLLHRIGKADFNIEVGNALVRQAIEYILQQS